MKPPLTWLKMTPVTFSFLVKLSSSRTQLSSRRAFSRDSTASPRAFSIALEIDLDGVADLEAGVAPGDAEFLERHPAFGLQADVDDGEVFFDGDDGALDDRSPRPTRRP